VAHIWDADGQLDWFAAWLWSTPWLLEPELVKDATGCTLDASTHNLVVVVGHRLLTA
jgi:hypothetical protein